MKSKAILMLLTFVTTLLAVEIDIPAYEAELDKLAEVRKQKNTRLVVERGIAIDVEKKEIILFACLLTIFPALH